MPKLVDLTGKQFGRLTVLGQRKPGVGRQWRWLCQCDCGKIIWVIGQAIRTGHTKSCGCLRRESNSASKTIHGLSRTKFYRTWKNIIARCYNPKCPAFCWYGGRGIHVCDRWRCSVENFAADMGIPPGPQYTVDRIDNDGDYCPENCHWATQKQQSRNTRRSRVITFNGATRTFSEWAETTGIHPRTIKNRIDSYGWTPERTLTTPVCRHKSHSARPIIPRPEVSPRPGCVPLQAGER